MRDVSGVLRALPKVELHCHFVGSIRPDTVAELARRNGVSFPVEIAMLYANIESAPLLGPQYESTAVALPRGEEAAGHDGGYGLLEVSQWVMDVLVHREDFARAVYESLEDATRASNVRYREMFFEPAEFMARGVSYATLVDGLAEGMRAAETDYGITCRLIAGIDRSKPPAGALELVETMIAHPRDEVIGIGLESSELAGAPRAFSEAYALAGRSGLHRTAHAGEHVPTASYVLDCLDVLGCERIDHGYFLLEDEEAVRRCMDDGVFFTCAFTTSRRAWIPWRRRSIRAMVDAGLLVTLGSDDPAMFPTTLADQFIEAHEQIGLDLSTIIGLAGNAIEASWMDDADKKRHRADLAAASAVT